MLEKKIEESYIHYYSKIFKELIGSFLASILHIILVSKLIQIQYFFAYLLSYIFQTEQLKTITTVVFNNLLAGYYSIFIDQGFIFLSKIKYSWISDNSLPVCINLRNFNFQFRTAQDVKVSNASFQVFMKVFVLPVIYLKDRLKEIIIFSSITCFFYVSIFYTDQIQISSLQNN
ncbi:unnamed protein product [Paramecium sonneborni]|uniref:Transmembrane protein n=1 Tax=Paramecium sonneborni TaxID=65129 RepID=A0A8S1LPI2_9CILI|nr:unnamed protein product [Paramecium sonneborni]